MYLKTGRKNNDSKILCDYGEYFQIRNNERKHVKYWMNSVCLMKKVASAHQNPRFDVLEYAQNARKKRNQNHYCRSRGAAHLPGYESHPKTTFAGYRLVPVQSRTLNGLWDSLLSIVQMLRSEYLAALQQSEKRETIMLDYLRYRYSFPCMI